MKITIIFQYLKLKKLNFMKKQFLWFFVYLQTFLRILVLFLNRRSQKTKKGDMFENLKVSEKIKIFCLIVTER